MKRTGHNQKQPLRRALIINSVLALVCVLTNSALPVLPRPSATTPLAPQIEVAASAARLDALAARTPQFSIKLNNTKRVQITPATAARSWMTLLQVEGRALPFPLSEAGDYTASISHPANRAPPRLTA